MVTPTTRFLDPRTPPKLGTLMVLTGIAAMTMNMFLPSLPSMTEFFATDPKVMQLSVSLFLALNGALQVVVGPLSDRYGRRPVMFGGFLIFVGATMGCLYAPDIVTCLIFRSLQVAVVVTMVLARAVIRDLFDQNEAASKIGYVTMGMALVPMLAPAIGGWLDETFGWQANFWVFFAFGLIGLALIARDVGETNTHMTGSFRAQFADYPELLSSPRFWGYALCAAFSSGAFFSLLGGGPFIATEIFGLSPTQFGAYFGLASFGYIIGNFISARLAQRLGINRLILWGSWLTLIALSLSLTVFLAGFGNANTFFGFMVFLGLGNGMVIPNAIAGSMSVRPELAGTASGLGGTLMIGGGAILSALAGSILDAASGPYPLLYIQVATLAASVVAIHLVIRRERKIMSEGVAHGR